MNIYNMGGEDVKLIADGGGNFVVFANFLFIELASY